MFTQTPLSICIITLAHPKMPTTWSSRFTSKFTHTAHVAQYDIVAWLFYFAHLGTTSFPPPLPPLTNTLLTLSIHQPIRTSTLHYTLTHSWILAIRIHLRIDGSPHLSNARVNTDRLVFYNEKNPQTHTSTKRQDKTRARAKRSPPTSGLLAQAKP